MSWLVTICIVLGAWKLFWVFVTVCQIIALECVHRGLGGQYLLNKLNLLDHWGNCELWGDSDETMSSRAARARIAGGKKACIFCAFLTWAQKIVTFGKVTEDHCDYALDKTVRPNSREIWDWDADVIRTTPINIVDPVLYLQAKFIRK